MKKFVKVIAGAMIGSMLFAGVAMADTTNKTIVTTAWPYLKEKPVSKQGEIYGSVPKGTKLTVLEETNKYYIKVSYKGQVGYISTLYIDYVDNGSGSGSNTGNTGNSNTGNTGNAGSNSGTVAGWEVKADKIIAKAKSLIGKVQYGFGKNDTKNLIFDCSSFTKYLYAEQGINLRWGARPQYTANKAIKRSELRKGDLVFFSLNSTMNNSDLVKRIAHVGIYMGNGKIIHNVNTKSDVTIADMTKGWWDTHYVAAARVLN